MVWIWRVLSILFFFGLTFGIRWLWKKHGERVKSVFQNLIRTRMQKALAIIIAVLILAFMGLTIWNFAAAPQPEPTPEQKYEIFFVENVLPRVEVDIPPLALNALVKKIEADEIVDVYRQYRSKESTTIIKYYVKFKGEDGYHLFYVPWNFTIFKAIEIGITVNLVQASVDTYLSQFQDIPDYIIPAEPAGLKRGITSQPWFPFAVVGFLIIGFGATFWWIMRRQFAAGDKFRKSCLDRYAGEEVTFDDVAGIEESKQEILEVVKFIEDPEKFQAMGAIIPKGILLIGPPGCGKTMLAKAIATEVDSPFIGISGSEFIEMFVGVGAARIRNLFEEARKQVKIYGRCIVFMDEIDAVGGKRGPSISGGTDERHQTLEQLMVEMDGFDSSSGIFVLAATNRVDILDPALIRPGRFDRKVYVDYPAFQDRVAILKVHTKDKPIAKNIDFEELAQGIPLDSSGADLANIVNEAAIRAVNKNKKEIDKESFQYAKDKIMLGVKRESIIMTEDEKKMCAYHEAGHALVAKLSESIPPLSRVSIVPRSKGLGYTQLLPERDRYIKTREELLEEIAMLMGGKASEEGLLNIEGGTTGVREDLAVATKIAKAVVCVYGMNEKMGPVSLSALAEEGQVIQIADETIKDEVGKVNTAALELAKNLIRENEPKVHALAAVLINREDIEGKMAIKIFEDETLVQRILAADVKELDAIIKDIEKSL